MRSKEALFKLYIACNADLLYKQNEISPIEILRIVEQDLERLEKMEKVIDLLKKFGDIEVWKRFDSICYLIECGHYKKITNDEYELLKEYFND